MTTQGAAIMAADVLVRNAWYVAGLSHEFPPQQLQGQVIAEKPLVMWRTAAGGRPCVRRAVLPQEDCAVPREADRKGPARMRVSRPVLRRRRPAGPSAVPSRPPPSAADPDSSV